MRHGRTHEKQNITIMQYGELGKQFLNVFFLAIMDRSETHPRRAAKPKAIPPLDPWTRTYQSRSRPGRPLLQPDPKLSV
jgi:hypothetical protein